MIKNNDKISSGCCCCCCCCLLYTVWWWCVRQASKCKIQKFNIPNLVFQLDAIRFVNHVILFASQLAWLLGCLSVCSFVRWLCLCLCVRAYVVFSYYIVFCCVSFMRSRAPSRLRTLAANEFWLQNYCLFFALLPKMSNTYFSTATSEEKKMPTNTIPHIQC